MNITESIFVSKTNKKSTINFFETEKYECTKKFCFYDKIEFLGTIQNKLFIFETILSKNMYIIDLKYFEIIQIINNNYIEEHLLVNNCLVSISFYEKDYENNEFNLKIEKKIFNFDKGTFKNDESNVRKVKYFPHYKIITTDNNLIALIGLNTITLFRL